MPSEMEASHTQERHDFVAVHEICPDRPYVELTIPDNVSSVTWVEFHATTHDQGKILLHSHITAPYTDLRPSEFMDNKQPNQGVPNYTFIESSVRRPFGRNHLRPFAELFNRGANPNFCPHMKRWELESCPPQRKLWMEELKPGDILQLTPKAFFQGWINFVKCARITIGYTPKSDIQTDAVGGKAQSPETSVNNLGLLPLNSDLKEFRLLVVQPGKPRDQLHCDLVTVSLTDAPQFEALSYCWQGTGGQSKIHIKNISAGSNETYHSRSVSSNVTDALQKLRYVKKSRAIWIDQLCINQGDNDEKASQVSMMAEIYPKAFEVHVWLGKGNMRTNHAMSLVRNIYNQQYGSCDGGEECNCTGTPHALSSSHLADSLARKKIKKRNALAVLKHIYSLHLDEWNKENRSGEKQQRPAMLDVMATLFSRPWFQRVWVLQEAQRAERTWVHCGKSSAPWRELLAASEWVESETAFSPGKVTMPSIWFNSAIGNQRSTSEGSSASQTSQLPFLDVFLHGLHMKATDPRDKIFALLPFGNDTNDPDDLSPLIEPSYKKSVGKVFADFTKWWITTYKSLSILSAITRSQRGRTWQRLHDDLGPRLPDHPTLPTSLPTWALGIDGQRNWDDRWALDPHYSNHFDFRASGNSIPEQDLLGDNSLSGTEILCLHGFKVTDIQAISYLEFDPSMTTPLDDSLKEMLSVYLGVLDPAGYYRLTTKGHNIRKVEFPPQPDVEESWARWRIQYMDHCNAHWNARYHSPPPRPLSAFKLASLSSKAGDFEACQTKMIPSCLDPFFFIASNKMVGLCPRPAKQGDIVAVLHGAKVPYLLRPVSDSKESAATQSGASTQKYEFIGECYVKDIMRGEYFEQQVDSGRRPDVFTLV